MFQKRHYEAIAKLLGKALADARSGSMSEAEIHWILHRFLGMLGANNPLFDRDRFLAAAHKHAGRTP